MCNLKGFGIEFVPVRAEHIPLICEWRNDPRVLPFMDDTRLVDENVLSVWLNRIKNSEKEKAYIAFHDNCPICFLSLSKIDNKEKSCSTGIFMSPNYINSGMWKLVYLLREKLLQILNIENIYEQVRKNNNRNVQVLSKLGGICIKQDKDFAYYILELQPRRQALASIAELYDMKEEYIASFD